MSSAQLASGAVSGGASSLSRRITFAPIRTRLPASASHTSSQTPSQPSLALVRTLRRRETVLPTAELTVINRRTAVALLSGLATMGALALFGFELRGELPGRWVTFVLAGAAAASGLLLLACVPAIGAAFLRPHIAGDAGDVFDDLGFGRTNPWRFARRVSLAVGLAVWAAGVVQGDPLDGAIRGFAEALACLGGFAVFGRFLALRR